MSGVTTFKQPEPANILPSFCIDIETCHAPDEAVQQELELWKAPSNWKPETVEAKRAEHAEKIREKSALLDAAPIATIGVCDELGNVTVFHWLNLETGDAHGFYSVKSTNEREMLLDFRAWADSQTDEETVIVGFNLGFDLPHLRIAYTRHNLKLPRCLVPRSGNPVADVQYLFGKYFTSKSGAEFSLGLDETVKRLGIAPEGKQMSGAEVPDAIEQGKHLDVITYNAIDTLVTMRAYLICIGQSGD